jgi:HemY protein
MRLWRAVLVLIAAALVAALGWHALADDPGYVQVRLRDTTLETSLVVAVAAWLLLWTVLVVTWRSLRWPLRAWGRAVKRRGRERLAGGITAFAEGDYLQAERDLARAAEHAPLRTPALLVLARAAHERGAHERATQALDALGDAGARAGAALRAGILVDAGEVGQALALLEARAAADDLSLRGRHLLIDTALAAGRPRVALEALPPLARSQSLTPEALAALEARVLAAALAQAPDAAQLAALWSAASRAQRRRPELVEAFARRSAAFGQVLAAMDEIEAAQRREWNDALAVAWGELGPEELAARTRTAEGWLALAPNSAALLVTLARLHVAQEDWGRADEVLERALALEASPAAWEALGDVRRGQGDLAAAALAYAHALRAARGESVPAPAPRAERAGLDTRPIAFEERSEHGVPRLPGPRPSPRD